MTSERLIAAAKSDDEEQIASVRRFLAAVLDPERGGKLVVFKGRRGAHGQTADRVSIAVVPELREPGR